MFTYLFFSFYVTAIEPEIKLIAYNIFFLQHLYYKYYRQNYRLISILMVIWFWLR